jgi:Pup-like protein
MCGLEWSEVMKQERLVRSRATKPATAEPVEEIVVEEPDADLLSDIDDLLEEIDSVLEDQLVLTTYRQRPGQ